MIQAPNRWSLRRALGARNKPAVTGPSQVWQTREPRGGSSPHTCMISTLLLLAAAAAAAAQAPQPLAATDAFFSAVGDGPTATVVVVAPKTTVAGTPLVPAAARATRTAEECAALCLQEPRCVYFHHCPEKVTCPDGLARPPASSWASHAPLPHLTSPPCLRGLAALAGRLP